MNTTIKVLHCNTFDIAYGAGKAAYRLHRALLDKGIDSRMLVQQKLSDDHTVIGPKSNLIKTWNLFFPFIDKLPLFMYRKVNYNNWNLNRLPRRIIPLIEYENPDIVHLHWIGNDFIPVSAIKSIHKPIVWTFHDMWAFTGGCHYTGSCTRYKERCGACPQLQSRKEYDISRSVWNRKNKHWDKLDFRIIALSRWMAESVKESSLLKEKRVELIPNCLDLNVYKPVEAPVARNLLQLPVDKKLILFGAVHSTRDTRKGFHFLQTALQQFSKQAESKNTEFVIFGASQPKTERPLGLRTHYLGTLSGEQSLALAYSAADVFIAPSTQDNLPNTVLEAAACGIPSVAFNIGGMPDLIEHQKTGYLADPFSAEDLSRGIVWILENGDRYSTLSRNARKKVEKEFSPDIVVNKHINLYNDVIEQHKGL
jgi:glycosyltransferase involved in cell wall biosynthesis